MTIKRKIIALNIVAAAISIALGGTLIYQNWQEKRELNNFSKVSSLLIQMIKLGDAWTHESGGVWGTTTHHTPAADVPAGIEEYEARIAKTDAVTEELQTLIASINLGEHTPRFRELLTSQLNFAERLNPIRNRQLQEKADPWPTTLMYNDQIKWLFSLIPQIATETSDAELVRKVIVSDLSLQTQLMINRHVGLLNYALSSGAVTEMVTTRFDGYLSDSKPLLSRMEMIMDEASLPVFLKLVDNSAFDFVYETTQQVHQGGFSGDGAKKRFPQSLIDQTAVETAKLEKSVPQFSEHMLTKIAEYTEQHASEARAALTKSLIAAVLAIAACVIGGWYIARSIDRTIRSVSSKLEESSSGGRRLSHYVSAAAKDLADGCSEQASSIEEIQSTMSQIQGLSDQSVAQVSQVQKLATASNESAQNGSSSMSRMRDAMGKIQVSSNEIAQIAKEIEEIAFQTNLLALNAAVEAARAGEAGAGFAIVADEVRNLAQKSATSAASTREKIENAHRSVSEGNTLTEEVDSQLSQILEQIGNFKASMTEVESISLQQRNAVDEVARAMSTIDNVTQRNAAAAEESASAASEMDGHARNISEQILDLEEVLVGNVSRKSLNTREAATTTASKQMRSIAKTKHENAEIHCRN